MLFNIEIVQNCFVSICDLVSKQFIYILEQRPQVLPPPFIARFNQLNLSRAAPFRYYIAHA